VCIALKSITKIISIATIIFLSFVLGCSSMSVKPNSRIAENLLWVISPVNEDKENYILTIKICNCVTQSIKENWEVERVNKFDAALSSYAQQREMEIKNFKKPFDVTNIQLSTPDDYLQSELKSIVTYVTECEAKLGGRVEF
jgi:hypothetical protein